MSTKQTARVEVYAIDYCPFCRAAKQLLDGLDIVYEVTDLTGNSHRGRVTSAILPGHRTAPLIVIDGRPIGGYDELAALHGRGGLVPLVFGEGAIDPGPPSAAPPECGR